MISADLRGKIWSAPDTVSGCRRVCWREGRAAAQRKGAVAPDGRLLVFGADPHTGIPASAAPAPAAFWLWAWNPQTRRWSVLTEPLVHPERLGCGLCWQAGLATGPGGATYLYVAHWFDNGDDNTLFRIPVPESPAGT